jgi:hypothetical protein
MGLRILSILAVVASAVSFAQSERGNITGIVTDPTGAAVAGVEMSVVNRDTNATIKAVTTKDGEYNAVNHLPGVYRIDIVAPGFKHYVQQNVMVAAATTVRLNAQLQLGQISEQVEVTAKMVDELPLVGGAMRSPFNLVPLVAEARGSGQRLQIGGGQVAQWDATLDDYTVGTNRSGDADEAALNTPSVEARTEFTVDTNGFKAEYGMAGGGTMTFASKSGTNRFHGSAYDFLRNDAMDARGFFAQTRSIYRQNDYGFTAAGPVIVPKLYNGKDKTFVSYEGFRNRVGANNTILSVPTPGMYKGDYAPGFGRTGLKSELVGRALACARL